MRMDWCEIHISLAAADGTDAKAGLDGLQLGKCSRRMHTKERNKAFPRQAIDEERGREARTGSHQAFPGHRRARCPCSGWTLALGPRLGPHILLAHSFIRLSPGGPLGMGLGWVNGGVVAEG